MPDSPNSKRAGSQSNNTHAHHAKRNKPQPYELVYWPIIPGRAEHIRLIFEETETNYLDSAMNGDEIAAQHIGDANNPPVLAPPILKHGKITISQTSNILMYLGGKMGLAGEGEEARYSVNQLALTALDGLSNEPHDCHHPISVSLYFEDQIHEAKRKSEDYINNRLPKFMEYFERVLKGQSSAGGQFLYGGKLTYADLVLFQCLDGLKFMFPGAMERLEKGRKYEGVFKLYARIRNRPKIKAYLNSERRRNYSSGIYRFYKELQF
jgi:glutathione S-transferase